MMWCRCVLLCVLVCVVFCVLVLEARWSSLTELHHVWTPAAANTHGLTTQAQAQAKAPTQLPLEQGRQGPGLGLGLGLEDGVGAVLPYADPDSDVEAVDKEERPGVSWLWSTLRWLAGSSGPGSGAGVGVASVPQVGSRSRRRLLQWPDLSETPPALQLYLKYHSRQALHARVFWSPSVCTHRVMFVQCGSGNYGTTMMRLLMALKFGIMTNTTVATVETPLYVSVRFLPTVRQFEVARLRMGCPRPNWDKDPDFRHLALDNPWKSSEFWTLTHAWKQNNCSEIYYPGETAAEREDIKRRWSQYYLLRCSDIFEPGKGVFSGQYTHLSLGDQWQAVQLVEQNPYFRALNSFVGPGVGVGAGAGKGSGTSNGKGPGKLPTVRPYIPDDEPESMALIHELQNKHNFSHVQDRKSLAHYRSDMVCELFRAMFRVDVDVAELIERVADSRPFDYFFHIRSIRGGGVLERQPLIIQQLHAQWAKWNQTHQAAYNNNNNNTQQTTTKTTTQQTGVVVSSLLLPRSPPPRLHPPKRMYILLDYGNRTETCRRFEQALPWLTCHYFSVSEWMSSHPGLLPGSLAPWAVSPMAAGQGWGVEPLWAALVDMYAVYNAEQGWVHPGSAYGRLVGWNAKDCQQHRLRNYDGQHIQAEPYREF